jgi:membrane-bound lytic murein transglycosylase B
MGRFRTALATISVGALLATGHVAQSQGSTPITDAPPASSPQPGTGPTGPTGPARPARPTEPEQGAKPANPDPKPGNGGGVSPERPGQGAGKGGNQKRPANPKPSRNPESATEVIPDGPPLSVTVDPNLGLFGSTTAPACDGSTGPPRKLIPIYIDAARKYSLGERGPQILAAINRIETDFGRLNEVTSSAGAIGWMQFMPATWDAYGVDGDGDGKADPYNARDAIHSAANYLSASGAPQQWYDAIFAYNRADWYVRDVLDRATCYGALQDTKRVDRGLKTFVCKPAGRRVLEIPDYYLRAFESAASRFELGQEGIWTLAAVARIESDYGRGMSRKLMKEMGPMGLSEREWKRYAVDGNGDGYVLRDEPWDGVATFARMLWANGGIQAGLFDHSHAAWYVEATTREAGKIAGNCDTVKTTWDIAYPRPTTNATEINWDNLQILNPTAADDIQSGLIDARVVNLLALLTQRYSLLVSSLRSDHSMMTSSGNVSNHFYGRALDIAAVNGVSCTDMSATSPCSEVGRILASLPEGAKPTELIYGYDLDGPGPAFAMADHTDHIHAGFGF